MSGGATTHWWWVRHAVVPNPRNVIYGALDWDCDTSNAAAFAGLARRLPRDAVWITSGMRRARQTAAAIVAAGLPAPPFITEPAFNEQSFGDWQGRSWDEVRDREGPAYARIWQRPADFRPPGGESFADQIARVGPAIDRLTAAHRGRAIVAVTHGGTIRAALAHALGLAPQRAMSFFLDNLSMSALFRIEDEDGAAAWRIEGVGMPPVAP